MALRTARAIPRRVIAFATSLIALSVPAAAPAAAADPDPWEFASVLPASTELLVVVDRAARQIRTPPGRALVRAIKELGVLDSTAHAWSELAGAIDIEPHEAFVELLGRRFTLAASGLVHGADEHVRWVLISTIDPEVGKRLTKGLAAAPRAVRSGRTILKIEDGRFELAVLTLPDRRDEAMLILAPDGARTLFDGALAAVAGTPARDQTPRLGALELYRAASRTGRGDIVALWAPAPAADAPERGFAAISARATGNGWTCVLRSGPEPVMDLRPIPAHVAQGIARLIDDDRTDLAVLTRDPARRLAKMLDIEPMLGSVAQGLPDGYVAAVARRPRDPSEHPVPTIGLAMQIDPERVTPARADQMIETFASASHALAGEPALPGESIAGRFPEAVRTVQVPVAPPLAAVMGERASLAWRTTSSAMLCVMAPGRDPGRASGVVAELEHALVVPGDQPHAWHDDDLISLGLIRPARLLVALDALNQGALPVFGAARWFDRIAWRTVLDGPMGDGARILEGTIEVRMVAERWGDLGESGGKRRSD